jgi:hypothetical protein
MEKGLELRWLFAVKRSEGPEGGSTDHAPGFTGRRSALLDWSQRVGVALTGFVRPGRSAQRESEGPLPRQTGRESDPRIRECRGDGLPIIGM